MKIGMRIPGMGRELGFEGVVRWAAANGFGAIDVPPITPEMKRTCDEAGLTIGTVDARGGGLLSADENKSRAAAEELKAGIKAAADQGCKVMFTVLGPDDHSRSRRDTFEIWKKVYPPIVEHAEGLGVSIAVEAWPGGHPHYANIGCTPEMWRAMFKECPSPSLGLCYDPSHLVRLGIDYLRALHEFGDRVRHVHGKDTEILAEELYETGNLGPSLRRPRIGFSEGWWRYCIPGAGAVDWGKVVARLETFGYDGPISIELEDGRFWDTIDLQKEGLLRAKQHLEQWIR